jgi:predicted XRE-type DNA-binding protein
MFVTLERLVSQRENLIKMFSSSKWTSSDLASMNLSRQICEIIQSENAFWCAAASILKVTGPIISVLLKLESDDCSMGVLYDAMDNAKEEIKKNLGRDHGRYWKLIDHIWDDYLHSPIHAAGYSLNPKIFYSDRFCYDAEISSGVRTCVLGVDKNHRDGKPLADQFSLYIKKSGLFQSDRAAQEAMEIPQGKIKAARDFLCEPLSHM